MRISDWSSDGALPISDRAEPTRCPIGRAASQARRRGQHDGVLSCYFECVFRAGRRPGHGSPPMTMFVFSRRAIQDKLEVLEDVLTSEQHAKLVDRLNQPGRDQMAVMWEAVFMHALDQVVPIRLAVALSNGRQPDFGLNLIVT